MTDEIRKERIRKIAAERGLDKKWDREEWKWDYGIPLWLMEFALAIAAAEHNLCVQFIKDLIDEAKDAHKKTHTDNCICDRARYFMDDTRSGVSDNKIEINNKEN